MLIFYIFLSTFPKISLSGFTYGPDLLDIFHKVYND